MLDLLVGFSILCQGGVLPYTPEKEPKQYETAAVVDERLPSARWTEVPYQTRGDDFIVTLSAEHINGIDRVEFVLDGGEPIIVTEKTPHPETGYPEYLFPVGQLEEGLYELVANVYATSGEVLTLEGDPLQYGNLDRRNNGINSFFFRIGDIETINVGPNGQFLTIDDAFAALGADIRGKRLLLEATHYTTGLSRYYGKNEWEPNSNPVIIEGVEGTSFAGTIGRAAEIQWVFKNITFHMMNNGGGASNAIVLGDRYGMSSVAWVDCTFITDPNSEFDWRDLGWQRYTDMVFDGGIYTVGNDYYKVVKGPNKVTLSKNDFFYNLTWDCLSANPAGVFNLWTDRQSSMCDTHTAHVDIVQYWASFDEEEWGVPTANRMFCDIRATNMYGQIGHFEGTRRPAEGGGWEPSNYANWYFARWEIDSHITSQSLNFYAYQWTDLTLEDMNVRDASIDMLTHHGGDVPPFDGLIVKNVVHFKNRVTDGAGFWTPQYIGDGYFENLWVQDCGNGGSALTGCGPVDWANPEPPIDDYICLDAPGYGDVGVSDPNLIDLSNTVFGVECYTGEDLAGLLQSFGSSDSEWDLNDDGIVNGKDIAHCLANFCS